METEDIMTFLLTAGVIAIIATSVFITIFISHVGATNDGSHTGVITAVEQEGWIWKTYRAYVKTNTQSSQEDKYCVIDPAVITQLKDAEKNQREVTVNYSAPFIVWNWQCGTEDSIIRSIN